MAASRSSPRSRKGPGQGPPTRRRASSGDGLSGLTEQLANRIIKPLGLVVLSRERIREVLDEAAEQGRITRRDSEELLATLVRLGSEPLERLVRSADRARRTMGIGPSFPITGYDDLTSGQVQKRLTSLSPSDLREVREYERRHANRKSVLNAIEKALR